MFKGLKFKVIFNFGLFLIIVLLYVYFVLFVYMYLMNVIN